MDENVVEIIDMYRLPDGKMEARVRLASGLEVVRGVASVALKSQITRANGAIEPLKTLAVSHSNPITEQRLRSKHNAGKVEVRKCE